MVECRRCVTVQGSVRQRGLREPQAPAKPFFLRVFAALPPKRAEKETPEGTMSLQTTPPERLHIFQLFPQYPDHKGASVRLKCTILIIAI